MQLGISNAEFERRHYALRIASTVCVDFDELNYLLVGERDGRQMIYVGHSVGVLFDKLHELSGVKKGRLATTQRK